MRIQIVLCAKGWFESKGRFVSLLGVLLISVFPSMQAQVVEKTSYPVMNGGQGLEFPFAGGLDAPQFSQVDLNRDGMQDVFVFDRQGNTAIPFVTTFHDGEYGYEIQWDVLQHLPELQQWALMLDFNGDGVEDLFASTNVPGVQGIDVYRGREEGNILAFQKMKFDLGDYDVLYFKLGNGFTPLYAAWIDVPAIKDIDGDGDIDILSFEPGGSYLHYFKNLALENGLGNDTFLLDWKDVCWGKFYENAFSDVVELSPSPGQCASGINNLNLETRHSGSASTAFDFEGDGDQDLLLGDLASPRVKLLINGGSAGQAWITQVDNAFPSTDIQVDIPFFVAPFVLDINHDGAQDIVVASNNTGFSENYDVAWYYRSDTMSGAGDFHLEQTALFVSEMLDFGSESKPTFFDYNADGLIDILFGTGGYYTPQGNRDARLVLLKNIGTATEPMFEVVDDDYQNFSAFSSVPTWEFAPAAGDIDQDGDVDLLVGERNGSLFFLENTAGPGLPSVFASPVYPYADINVGTSSTPDIIDLNGDGMPDIACGERIGNNDNDGRCSNLNYFENTGSPGNAQFISDPTQSPNTQCLGRVIFNTNAALPEFSAPAFVTTPDGLKLVVGSETGTVRIYRDIESASMGSFVLEDQDYAAISDGGKIVPALADIDDDGFYEMVLGNKRGGLTIYNTDLQVMLTSVAHGSHNSAGVQLLPNPSEGKVFLWTAAESFRGTQYEIRVHDLQGKLMFVGSGYVHGDGFNLHLQAGLYFAAFYSDYQEFVQKMVVN